MKTELNTEVTNGGRDEDSNTGNCEGITLRMLRQRLFQKDQGELVKILHNIFTRKLFQNRRRVGKFVDDLFQHRLSMQELSNLLYGCITFETEWNNVRGINYVNELLVSSINAWLSRRNLSMCYKCVCVYIEIWPWWNYIKSSFMHIQSNCFYIIV